MTYTIGSGGSVNNQGQVAVTFSCPAPAGYKYPTMGCVYLISSDGKFTRLSAANQNAYDMGINDSGDVAGATDPLSNCKKLSVAMKSFPP